MTLPGTDRTLPAFVSGSHADSVPQGGNYDGLAGIVAALCAAHWMRRHHYTPKRDFTVLMMRCEESSFFGKAYVGSLGMMGKLTAADLALKHRSTGETLGECIRSCGVDPERLTTGEPVIDPKRIAAFVELHIPVMRLASGAGHDSAVLGNCGIPVAMIFVANQKGSHNPHEAMELEDFIKGAELLRHAVEDFDL